VNLKARSDIHVIFELLEQLGDIRNLPQVAHLLLRFLKKTGGAGLAVYYSGGPAYEDQIFYETEERRIEASDLLRIYQSLRRSWRRYAGPHAQPNVGFPEPESEISESTFRYLWNRAGRGGVLLLRRPDGAVFNDEEGVHLKRLGGLSARILDMAQDYGVSERQVINDFLTGLNNRRYLDLQLPREIERARRFQSGFSLVLMDLDGFKGFNDTYGHRSGDRLLAKVGSVLSGSLRRIDVAARYGGDEFALILPETHPEPAKVLLRRIDDKIGGIAAEMGLPAVVGASFGVAYFPTDAATLEELVETADRRLYQAKEQRKAQNAATQGAVSS